MTEYNILTTSTIKNKLTNSWKYVKVFLTNVLQDNMSIVSLTQTPITVIMISLVNKNNRHTRISGGGQSQKRMCFLLLFYTRINVPTNKDLFPYSEHYFVSTKLRPKAKSNDLRQKSNNNIRISFELCE